MAGVKAVARVSNGGRIRGRVGFGCGSPGKDEVREDGLCCAVLEQGTGARAGARSRAGRKW